MRKYQVVNSSSQIEVRMKLIGFYINSKNHRSSRVFFSETEFFKRSVLVLNINGGTTFIK